MIVDLNPLPFKMALDIIDWCWEHNIDKSKCEELILARSQNPPLDNIDWTLDIPDQYTTYFILKWSQ